MGIEAFCPNGHRIKVKQALAGKKGLCPTCGAKFRIPTSGAGPTTTTPALPPARLLDIDPTVATTLPRVLPFAAEPFETALPVAPPETIAAERAAAPEPIAIAQPTFAPPPAPIMAPPPSLHPVLAERPDLQWCIAFPGGEPTEPLPVESMQAWLDSGQAEGTEVVWRSDWPEWRPARDVFPDVL